MGSNPPTPVTSGERGSSTVALFLNVFAFFLLLIKFKESCNARDKRFHSWGRGGTGLIICLNVICLGRDFFFI